MPTNFNDPTKDDDAKFFGQLDVVDGGSGPGSLVGPPDSDHALDGDFDLFDSEFFGGADNQLLVGLVGGEEDFDKPHVDHFELTEAAQRHLSDARKGSRKKANLVSFSEEDFDEGPQRDAFVIIKAYKNRLFAGTLAKTDVWSAIEWFFTGYDNGIDPTFDLCCRALDARIDVLRLRIHYEFYLRWWVSPIEFPFLTVRVPSVLEAEILYVAGPLGLDLCREAWCRPGISTESLIDRVGHAVEAAKALQRLDEKMILCLQGENSWYLTGRNPHLLRQRLSDRGVSQSSLGGSIHWSRML
jgi:hypothetical protein